MKKIILISALSLLSAVSYAEAPRFSADIYKAEPTKYMDKGVTLYITSARPASHIVEEGYVLYHCSTGYKGIHGGHTDVLVNEKKSRTFFNNFAAIKEGVSKSTRATMIRKDDKILFRVD